MWRTASKSIKSIFCKRQSFQNNVTVREARNNKGINCIRKLSPTLQTICNRSFGSESQKKSFAQSEKENPKTSNRDFLNDLPNILNVLIWGGFFAIDLYIRKFFHHKKVTFSEEQARKSAFDTLSRFTLNDYLQVIKYFTNVQSSLYVLPKTEARRENKNKIYNSEINEIEFDELEKAHRSVLGSLCNFRGADCMNKGNYTEAIVHFEDAAQVQNAAGIYNLGVCYEIGLGTNQDLKKAAELYKRASDLGHPTATYNLGVFYVRGLGDLTTDLIKARKLFQIAASLGQPNAQIALDMEESKEATKILDLNGLATDSKSEVSKSTIGKCVELVSRKRNNLGKFGIFRNNVFKNDNNSNAEPEPVSSDDSGAFDLSSKDQALHS